MGEQGAPHRLSNVVPVQCTSISIPLTKLVLRKVADAKLQDGGSPRRSPNLPAERRGTCRVLKPVQVLL